MCLTSSDFPEQFQSGSVPDFGFGLLAYKITQLMMNKMEQPILAPSGEARYLTSLYVSGKEGPQEEVKDQIRAALMHLTFLEQNVLVQFWSPCDAGEHEILSTIDQPFGLGVASDELCFYRRSSEHKAFPVDKDNEEIEECTSPPARVYRQGLPEWTSDITNYNSKDFPQQDLAIRCNLHGYMALPVFDIARKSCLGVLEILVSSKHMDYVYVVKQLHGALKKQGLTCPRVFVRPASYVPSECDKIRGILKSVCDYHNLPLAQTWAVSPSTSFVSHDKSIKQSCSSFGTKCIGKVCMSTVALPYYVKDYGMWKFMEQCRKRHMYKSQGVVGMALSFRGVYFCRDISELNQAEYPHWCGNKVKSRFAVSLHIVEGDEDYVLEFFLPTGTNDDKFVEDVVRTLKQKVEATTEFVLGDTSSLHLSDISDSESSVTDVSKTSGSVNEPDTESSTNVSMEKRRAAIFTDDGETSSQFKQGVKKCKVDHNPDLYCGGNF